MERSISLAVIAGNVEDVITRFLNHFQQHFDEVVVCIARGGAEADKTEEICTARGCKIVHYHNRPDHADWPHIDDFAAARNVAWQAATGTWIMWADTDDTIDPEHVLALRKLVYTVNPAEVDIISLPYKIPAQGIRLERERLARRGFAHWSSPVHECLVPINPDATVRLVKCTDVEIIHASPGDRPTSNTRNLRILQSIPPEAMTTSLRYHLAQELRGLRRTEEARKAIAAFLADPDGGIVERYECWINLAQLATDPAEIAEHLISAFVEDPNRAEALVELTQLHAATGSPHKALAFARMANALPEPDPAPWTLRRALYRHVRVATHAQALRANGRHHEADTRERNHFIASGAHISLLHATRGRPQQALQAMRQFLHTAADPASVEHIFAIDADDAETLEALSIYRHVVVPPGGGCVAAWNAAAAASLGNILVQLSDDWTAPPEWDHAIRHRMPIQEEAVLAISDGHRKDQLLCMAILNRKRYEAQGYLFHPEFLGVYSDNYFTDCAYSDEVVIDAKDIVFTHHHPAFTGGEIDATYARQNTPDAYIRGSAIYARLKNQRKALTAPPAPKKSA